MFAVNQLDGLASPEEAIVAHLLNQVPDDVVGWFFPRASQEAVRLFATDGRT